MEAYRFNIKISRDGTITVPKNAALLNKEAEVIILLKEDKKRGEMTAADFINKWAGVLKTSQIGEAKYNYLSEKYK